MSNMTSKRDYYEVLGLTQNASQDQIRKAYRELVRKHHPDVNQGSRDSEELFKDIKEAYDVLSDPERRRYYDQFGHAQPGAGGMDAGGFGFDFLDMFFGGGRDTRRRGGPQAGADLRYDLEITLEEAAAGLERVIQIDREQNCETCSGTGSRGGTSAPVCSSCQGSGQIRRTQQTVLGSFSTVGTCPRCQGEGTVITDPCTECRGRGRERVEVSVPLKIPAGVDTGNILQLTAEGDRGRRGGPPGMLKVVIHIAPHDRFERHGKDLLTEFPVSFPRAALGATVQVPTLTGVTELQIPAGTQPGQAFRVRGEGMPDLNGRSRGDLHVLIQVPVPEKLNDRQRRAIEEMAAAFDEDHLRDRADGHGLRGLLEKAKELFDPEK